MASVFPGAIDNFSTGRLDSTPQAVSHALDHDNNADAINKIEIAVKPTGILSGEVAVWDSVAAVFKRSFIKSATPPASPFDGQVWVLIVDATLGISWNFRYNASSASAFKWEYIGGTYMFANVENVDTTASAAFVNLANDGPSITVPRAGDYIADWEVEAFNTAAGNNLNVGLMKNNVEQMRSVTTAPGVSYTHANGSFFKLTGLAASDVIKLQYATSGGTATYQRRRLRLVPIRVS